MSKRSRHASFPPASEDEDDALSEQAPPTKSSQTDYSNGLTSTATRVMQCALAPHGQTLFFDTQEEYEVHYSKDHANRCVTCAANLPSPRLLELHIEENHNSLREALAARGEKTYGCFLEDCERKFSTPQKRRLHLIDKHLFPRTYNFRIVDQGIDKASSMLRDGRRRRVTTANHNQRADGRRHQESPRQQRLTRVLGQGKTDQPSTGIHPAWNIETAESPKQDAPNMTVPATELDNLAQSFSALRFVPAAVLRKQKRDLLSRDDDQAKREGKRSGQRSAPREVAGNSEVTST